MHEDKGQAYPEINDAELRTALMAAPGAPFIDFLTRHGLDPGEGPDGGFISYHYLRLLCPLIPTNDRMESLKTLLTYHPESLGLDFVEPGTDTDQEPPQGQNS